MKRKAYAKVNLGLRVLRKRKDNYHDLEMVMSSISLYDELTFKKNKLNIVRIINDIYPDNIVLKAANAFKEKYSIKQGVDINIKKRIPSQAGLGGGSSDAACTLIALNKLYKQNWSIYELLALGNTLGSDVSFCLTNQMSFVSGKGEKIDLIDKKLKVYLVLVEPDFKCSTKTIFENHIIEKSNDLTNLVEAIKKNDLKEIASNISNDLETTVNKLYDNKISEIKELLIKNKALNASMTGSGSVVFGIFEDKKTAKKAYLKLKKEMINYKLYLCKLRNN